MRVFNYGNIANIYESLAEIFSLGRIRRSKQWQLLQLKSGQSILYVGCGRGEDAVAAAKAGLRVTCVDITPEMLDGVRHRFDAEGLDGMFVCSNILDYQPLERFDAIAVNYFLNMFRLEDVQLLVSHCRQLLAAHGLLMIADFAAPPSGIFFVVQQAYWLYCCFFFALLGKSEIHFFYDYRLVLVAQDMVVIGSRCFSVLPRLAYPCYETLIVRAGASQS